MREFKLKDKVWTYSITSGTVKVKCPICHGTGYCIVLPWTAGDLEKIFQDHFKIKCEWCDGSGEKTGNYETKLTVYQLVIDGYDVRGGKVTEYKCNSTKSSYHTLNLKKCYDTEEEANVAGEIELKGSLKQNEVSELTNRGYHLGKMSYHRGYHIKEIEELKRKARYHCEQLGMSSKEFDKWIEDTKPYIKRKE